MWDVVRRGRSNPVETASTGGPGAQPDRSYHGEYKAKLISQRKPFWTREIEFLPGICLWKAVENHTFVVS